MSAGPKVDSTKSEVTRLAAVGAVGFYTHFEAVEIFALREGAPAPFNVFSIFVAEERAGEPAAKPELVGKRIRLKRLKGWTFGIQRTILPLAALTHALDILQKTSEWKPSGNVLRIGPVIPAPTQFVPPDSTTLAPWNRVLKNNFWSGSYVVELADPDKSALLPLFTDPPVLQELSAAIRERLPISIGSLSDRLGNLAFQFPVSVVMARFGRNRVSGDAVIDLAWHPKAVARPVRAICSVDHDNVISGYVSADIQGASASHPMAAGAGMQQSVLWDDQNKLILAATGETSFITKIGLNIHAINVEPRVFTLKDSDGNDNQVRVSIASRSKSHVGPVADERLEEWARKRIYRDEAARLASERVFVQYKPQANAADPHEKALADIRALIRRYGEDGAWLWDPYLTADDVLRTLFYSPHANTPLRALTAAHSIPSPRSQDADGQLKWLACLKRAMPFFRATPMPPSFVDTQRAVFAAAKSNFHGLNLEFRMRSGQAGWAFHDRFLIFPVKEGGALAWSLGTSVNSMGRLHHILQRVDDGQLVADAFLELWDALDQPEHLVWKTP